MDTPRSQQPLTATQQQFVIQWRKLMLKICDRFLRKNRIRRNYDTADHVISAAHLGLVRAAQAYTPERGQPGSYIGPIVINHMVLAFSEYTKRGLRYIPADTQVTMCRLDFDLLNHADPKQRYWTEDTWDQVIDNIDDNRDELTAVIVERYYRLGHSRRDIAEELGLDLYLINDILQSLRKNSALRAKLDSITDPL